VGGDKRGGTCGVDDQARAAKIEEVREPVGADAERAPRVHVSIADIVDAPELPAAVVVARHPDEDADRLAAQPLRRQPGVLQRFPGDFHQQALLRIDMGRLAGGNAEERGVESVDLGKEAAPARVHLSRRGRIVIVKLVHVPAIGRHLAYGVNAFREQTPEAFRAVGTGKPATDPDDGDRL
jgi:hypothetical protein